MNQISTESNRDGTLGMYSSRKKKSGNEKKPEQGRNNLSNFQKAYEQENVYSIDMVLAKPRSKQEITTSTTASGIFFKEKKGKSCSGSDCLLHRGRGHWGKGTDMLLAKLHFPLR